MKTKTTVIFHSADFDGIFCREIAKKFLPDAELIGWDFDDTPLPSELPLQRDAFYVMDLPLDKPFGLSGSSAILISVHSKTIWIDHHKSAIESHPKNIPGYRIDGVAACRMAWQWFNWDKYALHGPAVRATSISLPEKEHYVNQEVSEPLAVRLAGEYDIWDKRDPRAEIFQFGLRSRDLTESEWGILLSDRDSLSEFLLLDGGLCQRYQKRNDRSIVNKSSFIVQWEGLKFITLNTTRFNSLTFASKDVPETGHDALMGFNWNGKLWIVSLYHASHRKDLDLSQIAVKYGGGGHKGACGFTCDKLPFL